MIKGQFLNNKIALLLYKYINLLNRIQKQFATYEGILILKNQYLINNIFYYILCIIFRFIHILSFVGEYSVFTDKSAKLSMFHKYIKKLTFFYLLNKLKLPFIIYITIVLIIFILFLNPSGWVKLKLLLFCCSKLFFGP